MEEDERDKEKDQIRGETSITYQGQLGMGDDHDRPAPTVVRAEAAFGGSPVLTVACGYVHTLAVTKDSALWTFGKGVL